MSTPNVPFKTPLGHDELRSRTHRLSQRHRTILLLVDGRRPLAEVLGLAQQAGSSISHFEDVLRMGLVELPIDVVAPDPVMTEPGALATLRTTAVEVDVAPPLDAEGGATPEPVEVLPMLTVQTAPDADALAGRTVTTDDAAMLPAALMVAPDEAAALRALRSNDAVADAVPAAPAMPTPDVPILPPVEAAPQGVAVPPVLEDAVSPASSPASPLASRQPSAPTRGDEAAPRPQHVQAPAQPLMQPPERPAFPPPQETSRVVPATQRRRGGRPAARPAVAPLAAARPLERLERLEPVTLSELAHVAAPDIAPPPVPTPDDTLVEQVRALLAETVRQNPPPFVSRVPSRVSGARTLQDLRDLVLDIERYLSARRPRAGVAALQHARELLGLGNTVVAEDSRPWRDDEDEDGPDAFRTTR